MIISLLYLISRLLEPSTLLNGIMPIIIIIFGMSLALNLVGIPTIFLLGGIGKLITSTIAGLSKPLIKGFGKLFKGIGWLLSKVFNGVQTGLPSAMPKWLRTIAAAISVLIIVAIII